MDPAIFKAYDIRGVYPDQLDEEDAWKIGYAAAQFLRSMLSGYERGQANSQSLCVGRDMRTHSKALAGALIEGMNSCGANVIDIGMIDTPQMYFAVNHFGTCGGVQVTASHNPAKYNGFKISGLKARPVGVNTGLKDIEHIATALIHTKGRATGKAAEFDLTKEYKNHVLKFLHPKVKPLKIAVDASNGMAGKMVPAIFGDLPIKIIPLNFEHTGKFKHEPNPLIEKNLKQVKTAVKKNKCDFGICFDGDANPNDQILGISNSGAGTLNWAASCDCNWLSIEPNKGSSTGEVDDVNIIVDINGLAGGIYTCNIVVSDPNASNNPQTVGINLYVRDADGTLYVPSEYSTIQEAIDVALNGDTVIIAQGTYTGAGNYNLDFGGKAITVRSENESVSCIIDCENVPGRRGFYFHSGESSNSIASGLAIINGKANGGGIYCIGSSPTIENCGIIDNASNEFNGYGGGIYCGENSNPIISGCTISNNKAKGQNGADGYYPYEPGDGGDAYGGGIYCNSNSSPKIVGCNLNNNQAIGGNAGDSDWSYSVAGDAHGGAIYGYGNITITNCVISNNDAIGGNGIDDVADRGAGFGGGIEGNATIKNCLISSNQVSDGSFGGPPTAIATGGGIKTNYSNISNCTIIDNTATINRDGGGIFGSGSTVIINCIIWENFPDDLYGCSATYSCISDADSGTGVIHSDPCFVTGPKGDYYMSQIAAGQSVDSPCVDTGSDTAANLGMIYKTTRTDEVGDGGIVDMGYHYSIPNPADIDGDGDIDFADFAILAWQWLDVPSVPSADIAPPGGDNIVDGLDLGLLTDYWLAGK